MIDPGQSTIVDLLRQRAQQTPARSALSVGGLHLTYRELLQFTQEAAGALHITGVRPGDRVAVIAPNSPELLSVLLGSVWLGAAAAPVSPSLRGWSLETTLATLDPHHLWTTDSVLPDISATHRPIHSVNGWLRGTAPRSPGARGPGSPCMVLMTSGSTGPPKGVLCPHSQMLWWGTCVGQALELSPDDTLLTSLPLHHTNALGALMQAWLAGAHIAVADRFSSRSYWEQVATAGASVGYLLGGMASRVLDQTPPTNHRLRRVLAPGITSREHDILRDRFGVTALEGFGSTETNYAIGTALSDVRPGWMGKARPGFDVKLQSTDEISSTRHDGIVGELLLKTHLPGAFSNGYLGQTPDAPGLWRRTGDLVVEENGWYRFVGRRHDIIRVKGENVRAQDVETILNMHNSVRTSAVYTLGNAEQEIAAAVVPSSTELDLTNLVNHVRNQLPRWAVPRYLTVVEELPETETGKVDKPALMRRGIVPETVDLAPTHPTHRGAT